MALVKHCLSTYSHWEKVKILTEWKRREAERIPKLQLQNLSREKKKKKRKDHI